MKEQKQAAAACVYPAEKVNFLLSGTYKKKPGVKGIGNDDFRNDAGR
jgi:hypothetical protein